MLINKYNNKRVRVREFPQHLTTTKRTTERESEKKEKMMLCWSLLWHSSALSIDSCIGAFPVYFDSLWLEIKQQNKRNVKEFHSNFPRDFRKTNTFGNIVIYIYMYHIQFIYEHFRLASRMIVSLLRGNESSVINIEPYALLFNLFIARFATDAFPGIE